MAHNSTDFIPCMLIPLQNRYLLLPNESIAEVLPMPPFEHNNSKPNYWLGQCNWHSYELPIIDMESLIDNKEPSMSNTHKLCVIHGINTIAEMSIYAFPCLGAPQLIYLNESVLAQAQDTDESEFLHFQIEVGTKTAYIPNLDSIEATLGQKNNA